MNRSRLKELSFALIYCAGIALLFFRGVIFHPLQFHIPYDLDAYHRPISTFIADTLREHGHLPWWNPFSYMGEPFGGNPQAALFYPPTLITALLGNALYKELPYRLIEMQLIAHVALAGFGTYLFLRALGVTRNAALAGAAIFEVGGFFASHTQHLGLISGCAWLPFFLGSLYRLQEKRNFRWVAWSAVFLALMILPGFPAAYLPAFFFGPGLYLLWLYAGRRQEEAASWRWLVRPVLLLGCAILVGGLLAAASWLPAYVVSARSAATIRPLAQAIEGLSVEGLTSFIWPNLFGQLHGDSWLIYDFTMLYYYQSAVALVLLCGGITWLLRSSRAHPFLIGAGISGLWMLGRSSFVSLFFYELYPIQLRKGIYPYCLLAYFSFFVAVLCALTLSAYEKGERPKVVSGRPLLRSVFVLATVALVVYAGGIFGSAGTPITTRATMAGGSLLLVSGWLGLCWLVLRDQSKRAIAQRHVVSAAFCCVIVLDLIGTGSETRANTWEGVLPPAPPVVDFLHKKLGAVPEYRVDTSDLDYPWQTYNSLYRLPSANGFNPLVLRDTETYRSFFSSTPDGRQFSIEKPDSPLLDLAGIRYIITSKDKMGDLPMVYHGEAKVFENSRAFRRFFLVGGVALSSSMPDAVRRIQVGEASASQVAVVSVADAQLLPGIGQPATSDQLGSVEVISYEPNAIRLRVHAQRKAVLVATESYWDEWKAEEDGRRVPLVRADGVFRAVPVSPGVHEIRMFIVPRSVYTGAAISLASLLLCAAWIGLGETRRTGDSTWVRVYASRVPIGATLRAAIAVRVIIAVIGAAISLAVVLPLIHQWNNSGRPWPSLFHRPWEPIKVVPLELSFVPKVIHVGESYTMSMPQPVGPWAGHWVDLRVACDNNAPGEVLHFRQFDQQGQVQVTVDPSFPPCEVKVRAVRRSGEGRWQAATGSLTILAATTNQSK